MRHGGRAILCGQPADRSGQAFDRRDDLRRDDEQRHGKHRDSGEHQCDHDRAVRLRGDGGVGAGLLRDLQLQVDELADRFGHRIDGSIQRGDDEMVERGAIAAIQNRLEFGDALVRNAHARLCLVGQRGFVAGDAGGAIGLPMLVQGAQSGAHFCRRLGEAEIAVARLVRRIDDIDGIFVCDHLQIAHRTTRSCRSNRAPSYCCACSTATRLRAARSPRRGMRGKKRACLRIVMRSS